MEEGETVGLDAEGYPFVGAIEGMDADIAVGKAFPGTEAVVILPPIDVGGNDIADAQIRAFPAVDDGIKMIRMGMADENVDGFAQGGEGIGGDDAAG